MYKAVKKKLWAFCLMLVLLVGYVTPVLATAAEYNYGNLTTGKIVHAGDTIATEKVKYCNVSGESQEYETGHDGPHTVMSYTEVFGGSSVGKAWKVTEIYGSSGQPVCDSVVLLEYTESHGSQDKSCNHNFEYTTIREATETEDGIRGLQCSTCGWIDESSLEYLTSYQFFNWLCEKKIREAEGTELTINTSVWFSFNKSVMEALSEKPNLNLTINYTYQHKKYTVTIPAGTDVMALLNEDGYCGFRYLDQQFGGKEIQ
ncbi:MAG: hypothetical protein PUB13_02210 [Lachnospiraceae bacterium]|nr:hypothetical protein [Lachnospiraceae bacterium]